MVWGSERRLQPTWMEEYLQQHWIRSGRAIRRQHLMYDDFSLFEGGVRLRHLAMTDTHVAAATVTERDDGNDAIVFSLARPHQRVRYRPVTSLGTNPDSSSGLFHFPPNEATIEGIILLRDWLLFGLSGGHIFAISELGSVRQPRPEDMLRHLGWNQRNNIVSFAVQPTRFGNVVADGYMVHFGGNSNWSIGLFMTENVIGGTVRIWRRINGREFEIAYHMAWPWLLVWTHIDDLTALVLRRHGTWIAVIPLRVLERNLEEGVLQSSVPIVVPFQPPIQACPPAVSNGRMAAVDAGLTVWIRGGENYQDVLWRIQTPVERGLPAGNIGRISLFLNSRYFLVSSGHGINVYEADTGNFCYTLRREVWERWSPSIRLIAASQRHVVAWAYGLSCWDLDSRAGRRLGER